MLSILIVVAVLSLVFVVYVVFLIFMWEETKNNTKIVGKKDSLIIF